MEKPPDEDLAVHIASDSSVFAASYKSSSIGTCIIIIIFNMCI